jgi:hypothetical protein
MEPPSFETGVSGTAKHPEISIEQAEQYPPEAIDLQQERVVAAPQDGESADAARRDVGLPVPAPRFSPGPVDGSRVLVDAPNIPIDKQPEPVAAPRATPAPNRIAARIAELRTRANPGGTVHSAKKDE